MQLWLFAWAPLNQKGLDVSMGYFLLPMVMVLLGRLFYGERLSRVQTMAVLVAAVGVSHELWRSGSFSWATALVMFGYPPYFMLRRWLRMGRSDEHTSELQSLMRSSYAVFCLKKKK